MGPVTIVEQNVLPAGFFVVLSTAGPNSASNPVGVRELPGYGGLRQIPVINSGILCKSLSTRGVSALAFASGQERLFFN
jgi:hypothetical protein